jgi:F0F1-type ATP synthase assembly protein I
MTTAATMTSPGSLEQVANAAYLFMGMVFAGLFAGIAIDHAAGSSPRWTVTLGLAGVVLGFIIALMLVFRRRGGPGGQP